MYTVTDRMAYAPRLNRGAPKWPDSPLRVSIPSGRQRKVHPRTIPIPFSIPSLRSRGGGCLLSSARVLSHTDARARFEHLHMSRQGGDCGDTGTFTSMDAALYLQVYRRVEEITWIFSMGLTSTHNVATCRTCLSFTWSITHQCASLAERNKNSI